MQYCGGLVMGKKQQVPVTVSVRSEQVRDRPSAAICLSGFCCQLRNSTYGSAQVLQRMVTKSMSDAFIHRKWPVIIHKSLLHVPGPHLQDLRLLLLIQSFCIADWCIHAPPPCVETQELLVRPQAQVLQWLAAPQVPH